MSETYSLDYQQKFLQRERDCLDLSSQGGCFQLKPWRTFSFQYDGDIHELESLFLQVMKSINIHLENYPPPIDITNDFGGYRRVGEFWINELPKQFVEKFLPLMTEPPTPNKERSVDISSMTDREFAAYVRKTAKESEGKPKDLVFSLELYTLAERYWFYQNHRIEGDVLKIGIECSEDPCSTDFLVELVKLCGGKYVDHEFYDGKKDYFTFWDWLKSALKR